MAALSFQSTIELPVNDAGAKKEDIPVTAFNTTLCFASSLYISVKK